MPPSVNGSLFALCLVLQLATWLRSYWQAHNTTVDGLRVIVNEYKFYNTFRSKYIFIICRFLPSKYICISFLNASPQTSVFLTGMPPCMNGTWLAPDGSCITNDLVLGDLQYEIGLRFVKHDCGSVLGGQINESGLAEPSETLSEMMNLERVNQKSMLCHFTPFCVVVGNHSGQLFRQSLDIETLKQDNVNLSLSVGDLQNQIAELRAELRRAKGMSDAQINDVHKRIGRVARDSKKRLDAFQVLVPDWSAVAL